MSQQQQPLSQESHHPLCEIVPSPESGYLLENAAERGSYFIPPWRSDFVMRDPRHQNSLANMDRNGFDENDSAYFAYKKASVVAYGVCEQRTDAANKEIYAEMNRLLADMVYIYKVSEQAQERIYESVNAMAEQMFKARVDIYDYKQRQTYVPEALKDSYEQ